MPNQYTSVEERFAAAHVVEPNSGCWLWIARLGGKRPYLNVNGKPTCAYRYSYERFNGPIPEGLMICHKCNVPMCVNPDHIYAGTAADNTRDSVLAGTNTLVTNGDDLRRLSYEKRRQNGFRRPAKPERSTLTPEQWDEIERKVAAGATFYRMSKEYNHGQQAIISMLERRRARAALAKATGAA